MPRVVPAVRSVLSVGRLVAFGLYRLLGLLPTEPKSDLNMD